MHFSLLLHPKWQYSSFPCAVVLLLLIHASPCPRAWCTLGVLYCALGNRAPNRSWLHYHVFRAQIISPQWNSVNWELFVSRGRKDICKYDCLQYLLPVSQTHFALEGVSAETWGSEKLARLKGDLGKGCFIKFDIWLFRKLMFEVPGWLVLLENASHNQLKTLQYDLMSQWKHEFPEKIILVIFTSWLLGYLYK